MEMFHYTDKNGWNSIRSQPDWVFKALQPRDPDRPAGAYFTDIQPSARNLSVLCKRIRVPRPKTEYVFWFRGRDNLIQLHEGRGRDRYIFYSPNDYTVTRDRQCSCGMTKELSETFP